MDPYEDLSEDEHIAFLQLEKEFRHQFEIEQSDPNSNWEYLTADYMNKTLAAASSLGIDALSAFSVNTRNKPEHNINFEEFLRAVDSVIVQIRIANSRTRHTMSVGLTEAQKTKIHHFIEKIRAEVQASSASASKKDKIFDIIEMLAKEISKSRTRYERFADLARSLAGLSADIEQEGARPWWPWFEKIMGLLDDAKEAEPKLPKPPEIKKIEPPRGDFSELEDESGKPLPELDDEIPF